MNTLCFFSKTAYKKPCFQGLASGQGKFRPIGRGKRQRKRRDRSRFRPALFLPEHPAACAEADHIGQLHRPAPLLHQLCQQADVLFLGIPHRGNKAVERHFQNVSKRRTEFQFFQDFHDKRRSVAYGRVLANGFKYVEDQILEKQDLDADYDLLTGASFSMKNMIGLKNDVSAQRKDSNHKKQRYYGYTEDYGYGITGWLQVVVEDGKIVRCFYDEIFADHTKDIVYDDLKQFYRQSKYFSTTYEDPFPSGWDRHAFLVGFRTQMDNLNLKVCATQNMLDLTGLPHAAGRDMGMIWDNPNPDHAHLDMDPKNRPMYPAFINYLRMAKVVLEEMRKDGVFQ